MNEIDCCVDKMCLYFGVWTGHNSFLFLHLKEASVHLSHFVFSPHSLIPCFPLKLCGLLFQCFEKLSLVGVGWELLGRWGLGGQEPCRESEWRLAPLSSWPDLYHVWLCLHSYLFLSLMLWDYLSAYIFTSRKKCFMLTENIMKPPDSLWSSTKTAMCWWPIFYYQIWCSNTCIDSK